MKTTLMIQDLPLDNKALDRKAMAVVVGGNDPTGRGALVPLGHYVA